MSEIAEDVRARAKKAVAEWEDLMQATYRPGVAEQKKAMEMLLVEVIDEERERCAKIADEYGQDAAKSNTRDVDAVMQNVAAQTAAECIASSIRGQSE